MAKQRNIGSGVVAAARGVSAVQGRFQDVGEQFMTGFNKALESKREKEAENKAIQDRTNNYISQFDSYVDLVDYSDSEKSIVKNTVVGYRNEFANAANELAKISDMSSPRAMELQDTMNEIRSKMERLRGNLEGLAKLKVEYVENFDKHKYSLSSKNTDNISRANSIIEGQFQSINSDGSLNFKGINVEDFTYSTKSFKKPFGVAKAEAQSILNLANAQAVAKGPILDHVKKNIELQVGEILSTDDALYSILSNSELQLIPLDSIDPDDPNARDKAIQMVTQAIVDTRGKGLIPDRPSEETDEFLRNKAKAKAQWDAGDRTVSIPYGPAKDGTNLVAKPVLMGRNKTGPQVYDIILVKGSGLLKQRFEVLDKTDSFEEFYQFARK